MRSCDLDSDSIPWATPTRLEGNRVALVPLSEEHAKDLADASADGNLSALWYTTVPAPQNMLSAIQSRLRLAQSGSWIPYAAVDPRTNHAVGMTSFLHIVPSVRRLEIGGTWFRASAQRTGINIESKFLLLRQAFEQFKCIAVELRTNRFNQQSRRAIESLGARLDGVLRNHYDAFGKPRDTCVYSIISDEWSQVKDHLMWRLARYPLPKIAYMNVR